MGVNENTSGILNLTLEIFQEIFEKLEPDVTIDSFQEAQGSERGDNYTAHLYRVHLTGYRKNTPADASNTEGKTLKWEKSVICKRLPDNAAAREAFKSVELFRNEFEFYTTIMPELIQFQKAKTKDVFKAIPQCYFAKNDILIMEDLRPRGFKMQDRQKGLSVEQTRSVLKEIAQLHSLSLSYKHQNPKQFEKLRNLITEGIFSAENEAWYKNYYEKLTKNAVKMIIEVLSKNSKYVQRLLEFTESSTFFTRMIELVTKESEMSVICHGDCWINNFMYRYDDTTCKVSETCLVDFQLIRYGSPALDISNLIFCCTSSSMRKEYLDDFLQFYVSELFSCLEVLGPLPTFVKTEESLLKIFKDELKEYGKFALGLALDIIPISTCQSEDAPDLYIDRSDETTEAPELDFPPNDLCKQKLSELLIDLVDLGML